MKVKIVLLFFLLGNIDTLYAGTSSQNEVWFPKEYVNCNLNGKSPIICDSVRTPIECIVIKPSELQILTFQGELSKVATWEKQDSTCLIYHINRYLNRKYFLPDDIKYFNTVKSSFQRSTKGVSTLKLESPEGVKIISFISEKNGIKFKNPFGFHK